LTRAACERHCKSNVQSRSVCRDDDDAVARAMSTAWWDAPAATTTTTGAGAGATGCVVDRARAARLTSHGEGAVARLVSAKDLKQAMASTSAACVAFTAEWCAPCVRFKPKFASLAREFGEVAFAEVDIDALDDEAAGEAAVETVPTFVLVKNGVEVARIVGVAHKRPARPIAAAIKTYLL
jgi:thioredoxin 1